ncbi:MAG: tRNA pseudouridine(13) synthase TruD [Sedimentisphaerales bacterium]|nr:tRNA pseudouridine(13) synthase TruD [Sedimentisphaerales bacterium]
MLMENPPDLPFLTSDIPGTGGEIKVDYADFQVEEIALYEPSGTGDHTYLYMEKTGMATNDVVNRLAKDLRVSRNAIGYAGRKDTRAVTRQWFSIEGADPEKIANLAIPNCRILRADRHTNKIKIGHHSANRFLIRIKNLAVPGALALEYARAVMDRLTTQGVPNFFGPQRFGSRFDSHMLGEAIVRDQREEFIDILLGRPYPNTEMSVIYTARDAYEKGDYQTAYDAWPTHYHDHRHALKLLKNSGGDKNLAFKMLDRRLKRFVLSAYQAYIFNAVLAARIDSIGKILPGELAYKHDNGAVFRVEDPQKEQPRADAFEISPSGPLIGLKMIQPTDQAQEIEAQVVAQANLDRQNYQQINSYRLKGARRSLRFQPRNAQVDLVQCNNTPAYLELRFELPPGCYATTLICEITK